MMPTRRLFVTLLIPVLFLAGQRFLLLPGLNREVFELMMAASSRGNGDYAAFSLLSLGLAPALSAFLIVEAAALIVPQWRELRRGSPAQRRSLVRAALILTMLLALTQGWFVARLATSLGASPMGVLFADSTATRVLITVSLAAGTALAVALASLLGHLGLGNGISVLLLTPFVPALGRQLIPLRMMLEARDLLWLTITLGAVVLGTRYLLTAHLRATTDAARIRLPTSGLVPLISGASAIELFTQLAPTYAPAAGTLSLAAIFAVLIVVLTLVLTSLFLPATKLAAVWRRALPADSADPMTALPPAIKQALWRTLGFLLALGVILPRMLQSHSWGEAVNLIALVTVTAVALDLVAEWRARSVQDDLVVVWPLHQVALLDAATTALERASIFVHARAANHRALLWFFGPYLPIELMVPRARALEARDILAAVLLDAPQSLQKSAD